MWIPITLGQKDNFENRFQEIFHDFAGARRLGIFEKWDTNSCGNVYRLELSTDLLQWGYINTK